MMSTTTIQIRVNAKNFTATLIDNDATAAFIKMLPLTLDMIELNANEKYGDLAGPLPVHPIKPKTIQSGDLMLYGSTTLVLFYKSFPTSYSYTRLGAVDEVAGWANALGNDDVRVAFELV